MKRAIRGARKYIKKVRPPKPGTSFHLRLQPEPIAHIDAWRRGQSDRPTRLEAIRRLIKLGLKAKDN